MSKNKNQLITKTKRLFIAMLAFFPWVTACANDARPPQPPLSFPFAVQQAGSRVETEMRIVERKQYSFRLQFSYKEGNQEDRERVRKLVGSYEKDRNGNLIDPGIPTPLKFKIYIIDASGERLMLERDIPVLGLTSWGGDSFGKIFAFEILNPGHYRVIVESLKDAPELAGTAITFVIGFRSKP